MTTNKHRNLYRRKYIFTSVGIFIIAFVISSIILTGVQVNNTAEDEIELKSHLLADRCSILNTQIQKNLENCEDFLHILHKYPQIQEFTEWRASNDTLDNEFDLLSPSEKIEGTFYTEKINSTSLYQTVLQYFQSITDEQPGLEMIRMFWGDGNLIVGTVNGIENIADYEGDKSWFLDSLQISNPEELYVSPISIARRTNTTAIRMVLPLVVGNETVGVLVTNYGVNCVLEPLFDVSEYSHQSAGEFFAFLDLNYETAEGIEIGEIYIVRSDQPNLEINESTAGDIEFKAEMFEEVDPNSSEVSHDLYSIMIDEVMYYYHHDSLEFSNRQWFTISAEPAVNFTIDTQTLQTRLILFYSLLGIVLLSLAIGIAIFQANRFTLYEEKVKELRELLPICSNCKKIRTDDGYWTNVEDHFRAHGDTDFTHGICPECAKKLYGDFL
ncbi:MAG: hypothetical protein E4G98_06555 [Promethearchaeota archaeon]|nr:MAG: hypothetical protein E4G98_06555 [Candidatus Lokiarchaeota archaeon]